MKSGTLDASKLELKNRTNQIFSEVKCVNMVAVVTIQHSCARENTFKIQIKEENSNTCDQ